MQARKQTLKNLVTLKNRADFVKLNKHGRRWISHGLILQVSPNDLGQIRVGYTVTKKVHKSAVKRNRIRRRLKAAAADVLPSNAAPSHDYVLIGRHKTIERPYDKLTGDVRWCLKKLNMLDKTHDEPS